MTLVLDAGAFVAVERGERDLFALLKRELQAGRSPVTHGGVVGQVWRDGRGRQANLARLLRAVSVIAVDEELGRAIGALLAVTGGSDVVDAGVVLLCSDGDEVFTSDVGDLVDLADAAGRHVELIPV